MLGASSSPLVRGNVRTTLAAAPALVTVRVLRAFCVQGQRVEPGQMVELDVDTASLLAAVGKVVRSEPAAAQAATGTSTEVNSTTLLKPKAKP